MGIKIHQLDRGGDVVVGVAVMVVWSTESRDAERLKSPSSLITSRSPPSASPLSRLPCLTTPTFLPPLPPALLPPHCTVSPRPTVKDSHFCRPLFFFFRLKKQQHLEMKQTLIGLRIASNYLGILGGDFFGLFNSLFLIHRVI